MRFIPSFPCRSRRSRTKLLPRAATSRWWFTALTIMGWTRTATTLPMMNQRRGSPSHPGRKVSAAVLTQTHHFPLLCMCLWSLTRVGFSVFINVFFPRVQVQSCSRSSWGSTSTLPTSTPSSAPLRRRGWRRSSIRPNLASSSAPAPLSGMSPCSDTHAHSTSPLTAAV